MGIYWQNISLSVVLCTYLYKHKSYFVFRNFKNSYCVGLWVRYVLLITSYSVYSVSVNWTTFEVKRYTLTYLLTYSMVQSPFEKLTGFQIVENCCTFYGTRRFITAFTSARHLSLSKQSRSEAFGMKIS